MDTHRLGSAARQPSTSCRASGITARGLKPRYCSGGASQRWRGTCGAAAAAGGGQPSREPVPFLSKVGDFVSAQFLPLALSAGLAVGCLRPEWGAAAAGTQLNSFVTAFIFILSGLNLKHGEAVQALKLPGCLLYGLVSILALSPLVGLLLLRLPFEPPSLALGLTVFACMPTALSSGIAMTQQLGGNVAMAILLTVAANVMAVFTMPHMLSFILGSAAGGMALDPTALFLQLVQLVLIPTFVGALARAFIPGVAKLVDSNKQTYGYLTATCLSVVPWMQVSKSMLLNIQLSWQSILSVVGVALSVHFFFIIANTVLVRLLNLGGKDPKEALRIQQVLVLLGSQKTLPVAVAVLTKLTAVLGPTVGLGAVAAVISHLCQTITDSLLVSLWLSKFGPLDKDLDQGAVPKPV